MPCMHSDVLTRVESSANSHPNRSGVVLAHALELVTLDKPSVGGVRTVDEAKAVRLAELEKKNAEEQARRRGRKARAKAKRLNEANARLNEAIHLIHRLMSLFQKPLMRRDASGDASGMRLGGMRRGLYFCYISGFFPLRGRF